MLLIQAISLEKKLQIKDLQPTLVLLVSIANRKFITNINTLNINYKL